MVIMAESRTPENEALCKRFGQCPVDVPDSGIDYEGISIGRKASRWLQKLEQYGYVTRLAREEQPDMSAQNRPRPGVARNRFRPITRPFPGSPNKLSPTATERRCLPD